MSERPRCGACGDPLTKATRHCFICRRPLHDECGNLDTAAETYECVDPASGAARFNMHDKFAAQQVARGRRAEAALQRFAAEAHRRKWAYDRGTDGGAPLPSATFDELHKLGNEMLQVVNQLAVEDAEDEQCDVTVRKAGEPPAACGLELPCPIHDQPREPAGDE